MCALADIMRYSEIYALPILARTIQTYKISLKKGNAELQIFMYFITEIYHSSI